MGLIRTRFLTPQGEKNLTSYKYSGSDASLLYKYFFSPCAQYLVDNIIPPTLAPNVITLTGFMCTLIPHLIVLIGFGSELSGNIPSWVCFLAGIGQLWYMILDNADGKQARKTGSSSPLGLLFDHGCDAMNTFVSGLTLFRIIQLGNTASAVYAFMIAMTTFFMATWEEYYVESLNLPAINGANEGIFFVIVIYFVSGVMGCDIWTQQVGPLKLNEIILASFVAMAFVTIVSNILNVYRYDQEKFSHALHNLFMISYINVTLLIVAHMSNSNVISTSARTLIYFAGFSFAKLVGHLQASHVAHEEFRQYKKSMIFSLTLLNLNTLVGYYAEKPLFSEEGFLLACFLFAILIYAHFVFNIISQFTRVLKIYVFKLGARDSEDLLQFSEEFGVYVT